jgi:extracellular factor (EF) 3-hydroxypalmitic acid methyl ester biosynthesis protein
LELFYTWVKPGGLVLVTNVTPHHSSRGLMGLVLDWNLELRDQQGMRELAPDLGQQRTYEDATGVNVFLEIRK